MKSLHELLAERQRLLGVKRLLDRKAPFQTEEGFHYANTLVKLTCITIKIEQLLEDKKKATTEGR